MRGARFGIRALLALLPLLAVAPRAIAQENGSKDQPGAEPKAGPKADSPTLGPGAGAGERKVEPAATKPENPAGTSQAAQPAEPEPEATKKPEAPSKPAHQRGPRPKKPRATLPEGVPRAAPNAEVRRGVAGGATADDLAKGTDDPELRALREAERVLFPQPLHGARPGWSWTLPEPEDDGEAEVVASGLPPKATLEKTQPSDIQSGEDAEWLKSLTMPNLPVRLDPRVVKYLKFYRDTHRGQTIAHVWAKKAGRYAPTLKAELAKAGLPTDLVWLSMIESGHNPTIKSPAGAAGLWQFIPSSGQLYGLTVDRWVDERLDPRRSTEAAIRFLSDLHRRFGNWELAMAAYNMGYGGLSRAIKKFNTNDFWELSRYEAGIPWETTLYVPKIMALAVVMNNKKAFGIDDVKPDPTVSFDTVLVEPGTRLDQVARAADLDLDSLKRLNAQYLAGRVPPVRPGAGSNAWPVRVPTGKGVIATHSLAKSGSPGRNLEPYVVRFGDTVETVAQARGTSERRIRRLNGIQPAESLAAGTVLLVPKRASASSKKSDTGDEVVVVPPRQFNYPDRRRVFYQVRGGDSLGRVARALGVTRSELVAWNSLDTSARLQGGMTLQAFVPKREALDDVRHLEEGQARVLVAGTAEFFDYFEGLKGKKRMVIVARQGDSLRSIGKRYGMSTGWMERVNRRSRRDDLQPGELIVVYADQSVASSASASLGPVPAPLPQVDPPRPEALPGSGGGGSPRAAASGN